jgi:hypothetical protein
MHRKIIFFLLWLLNLMPLAMDAGAPYSIVFIHIGDELPSYLEVSAAQARLFNPKADLYLVANQGAMQLSSQEFRNLFDHAVPCEKLGNSKLHKDFLKQNPNKGGFWLVTSQRFLYLNELMHTFNLKHVFHLENDVMLYVNLNNLLPQFKEYYPGIAVTFDNDDRCIPGFVYVSDEEAMRKWAAYFVRKAKDGVPDMVVTALFKDASTPKEIDYLPIIMEDYVTTEFLVSRFGHTTKDPMRFCNHFDGFQSIFDAAAIGQFFDGVDTHIHKKGSKGGFINERCLFNPSLLNYVWEADIQGRLVPYAIYNDKKYRINNLHIHSKNLAEYKSKPGQ